MIPVPGKVTVKVAVAPLKLSGVTVTFADEHDVGGTLPSRDAGGRSFKSIVMAAFEFGDGFWPGVTNVSLTCTVPVAGEPGSSSIAASSAITGVVELLQLEMPPPSLKFELRFLTATHEVFVTAVSVIDGVVDAPPATASNAANGAAYPSGSSGCSAKGLNGNSSETSEATLET